MFATHLLNRTSRPSRILADLAEGRLDDDETDAVALWLGASGPAELPEDLIRLGLRARGACAAIA